MSAKIDPIDLNRWFWVEAAGVLTGAAYTILITYGSIWCWPFAIISPALFTYLCINKKLYAETVLQLFYIGFAIYGWITWGAAADFSVTTLSWQTNLMLLVVGFTAVAIAGTILKRYTEAKLPYIDSFTTIFSLIATWMMIHTIFENWIYWLVIDSISIFMYANRKLYLASLLFFVYTILAINGLYEWVKFL